MKKMKKNYILIYLLILSICTYAQSYQFGIVHNSGYNFKVVAIPDFTSSGNTDISDIGFSLVLPAGTVDVINQNSLMSGRTWTLQQFDATFLTGLGLGDGSKDVFLFNNPPGQSLVSHNSGDQIDLVSFDISGMPTTDEMYFLLNSDPIAMGAGSVLDSFFNSNIDNTSTQDYYSGVAPGMSNFMFSTLTVEEQDILESDVLLYPNPTKEFVRIKLPANVDLQKVELHDISGKLVLSQNENKLVNVSALSAGLYLVTIEYQDSKVIKRLIIE